MTTYTAEIVQSPKPSTTQILRVGRREDGEATELLVCIEGEPEAISAIVDAVADLRPIETPVVVKL